MPTTEAGHAASRTYVDQEGNYHLNGGTFYTDESGTALAGIGAALVAAGGTLTVTAASHAGKIIALDTAAGSVITLPAATGTGHYYRFIVTVTATSNSHIVKVANATDVMRGFVNNHDQDGTTAGMYSASGTDDTITLNRTTTGGVIGDRIDCIDMLAGFWWISGTIQCVAGSSIADPLSATVS